MRIDIENVCKIQHASVKLDGLTIIDSENDTGKSTVVKLLYTLIKTNGHYLKVLNTDKPISYNKFFSSLIKSEFNNAIKSYYISKEI